MSKRNDLISLHYTENYSKLVKRTRGRVPENSVALAEEVVQEAYARALKYFRTYNPKTNTFDIWFQGILRNAINDCRTVEKEHGATLELHENIEELIPPRRNVDTKAIWKQIDGVEKERERHILMLFFVTGFLSKDIAEYLGTNHNTVRQVILRFKNRMNGDE